MMTIDVPIKLTDSCALRRATKPPLLLLWANVSRLLVLRRHSRQKSPQPRCPRAWWVHAPFQKSPTAKKLRYDWGQSHTVIEFHDFYLTAVFHFVNRHDIAWELNFQLLNWPILSKLLDPVTSDLVDSLSSSHLISSFDPLVHDISFQDTRHEIVADSLDLSWTIGLRIIFIP